MKISPETLIKNIINNTVRKWRKKLPNDNLDSYDNWKDDIVTQIMTKIINKQDKGGEETGGVNGSQVKVESG